MREAWLEIQTHYHNSSFAKLLVVSQVLPACIRSFSCQPLRTPYNRQDISILLLNSCDCSCDGSKHASLAIAIKEQMTHSVNNPGCLSYTELLMLNTLQAVPDSCLCQYLCDASASASASQPYMPCRSAHIAAGAAQSLDASAYIELPGTSAADPASLLNLRHSLHLVLLSAQTPLLTSTSGHHSLSASPKPSTSPISIAQASLAGSGQGSAPGTSGWAHDAHAAMAAKGVHGNGALHGTFTMSAPHAAPSALLSKVSPAQAQAADSLAVNRSISLIGSGHAEWRPVLAARTGPCSLAVDMKSARPGGQGLEVVATVRLDILVYTPLF